MMPEDIADQLLDPDEEVLLALPGIPDDKPRIVLVTRDEVILGRWNAVGYAPKDIKRKRAVPTGDVRGASYRPGLYYKVEIDVRSAWDLSIEPCTVEDGIRFAHALQALATTGEVPPPLPPADVVAARHARGTYSPDSVENRMRAAWDRAILASRHLWNCEEVHSGPALGWLYPGEHTFLVLIDPVEVSTAYLAVTDRRVMWGRAPGQRTKDRAPADVREAVYEKRFFRDVVRIKMHDGSSLKLSPKNSDEGHEFVDALNTLLATGSLPQELLPFR